MAAPLSFRALLPARVACVEETGAPDQSGLLGEEQEYAERMIVGRRAEFAAGRRCARGAMTLLGIAPTEIRRSATRAPIWPTGIVGSITHATGVAAAAAAHHSDLLGVGIDLEAIDRFHDEIARYICTDREFQAMQRLDRSLRQQATALTFSAKECMYKVWAPQMGTTLPFSAVEIIGRDCTFDVVVVDGGQAEPARAWALHGRWEVQDGLMRTSLVHLHG